MKNSPFADLDHTDYKDALLNSKNKLYPVLEDEFEDEEVIKMAYIVFYMLATFYWWVCFEAFRQGAFWFIAVSGSIFVVGYAVYKFSNLKY